MTSRQGEQDDRDRDDQSNETKRSRRMGTRVDFPFDRDREHLAAHDRQ